MAELVPFKKPDPDTPPSNIGFYTGYVKQAITIGDLTGECEQVVALAFVAVKDIENGREWPAYHGDLIVYYEDPTTPGKWLVGVIPYKMAVAMGVLPEPVLQAGAQAAVTEEDLKKFQAAEVADFEAHRFSPTSNVFVPSVAPPPPPPPEGGTLSAKTPTNKTADKTSASAR